MRSLFTFCRRLRSSTLHFACFGHGCLRCHLAISRVKIWWLPCLEVVALSINNSVVVSVSRGNGMQTNEFTCQNKWVIVFLSCISNYDIHNYMIYPECIMGPHNQVKYCFALTYYSVVKSFWNFAQSMAVSAPNFAPLEVRKWFDHRNGCSGQTIFR